MSHDQWRTFWMSLLPTLSWVAWLIVYDAWTATKHGNDSTISIVWGILIRDNPIINTVVSVAVGIVIGHVAWAQDKRRLRDGFQDGNQKEDSRDAVP